MEESADPDLRAAMQKINNQAEIIRTLKSQVGSWQAKCGDLPTRKAIAETEAKGAGERGALAHMNKTGRGDAPRPKASRGRDVMQILGNQGRRGPRWNSGLWWRTPPGRH